jgi:alpha-2-macroglobulin
VAAAGEKAVAAPARPLLTRVSEACLKSKLSIPALGRRTKLTATLLFMLAACMRGEAPPNVAPRGVLSPGSLGASAPADNQPFGVVFAAPSGDASEVSEISIVFSRPLRSLDLDAQLPPISISPALPGRWLWVGARALRFAPERNVSLPGSTAFRVEVPAGTRALDGSVLGKPYTFSFTTPRVQLVRTSPVGKGQLPNVAIDLYFSQVVEPKELSRTLSLTATRQGVKAGPQLKQTFRVEIPEPASPKHLRVIPSARLPLNSRIDGVIAKGLRATEGPVPAENSSAFTFSTYGPLQVSASCYPGNRRCQAGGSPQLEFSNPVSFGSLKRALTVTPAIPLRWESWQRDDEHTSYFGLPARLPAGSQVTLRLGAELLDRHGQKLGTPFEATFALSDYDPQLQIGLSPGTLTPAQKLSVPVGSVNLPTYDLVRSALTPNQVLALTEVGKPAPAFGDLLKLPGAKHDVVAANGARNAQVRNEFDLTSVLSGGRGAAVIAANGRAKMNQPYPRLVKVSDLAITAKVGAEDSAVWVTRLSTAESVADAEVSVHMRGAPVRTYRTDSSGIARIAGADFKPKNDGYDFSENALLVARSGQDWTYESLRDHVGSWRLPVAFHLADSPAFEGMVFTERGVYRPGDSVRAKVIVRRPSRTGNELVVNTPFEISLVSPSEEVLETQRVTSSAFGTFAATLRVPASAPLGGYTLRVTSPSLPKREHEAGIIGSFAVAEYRPAEFSVSAKVDAPSYVRGQTARFRVTGDYLFGGPMAGAKAHVTLSRAPEWYEVPKHPGYVADASALYAEREDDVFANASLGVVEGSLDASGRYTFDHPLSLPDQRRVERVIAAVEVTDASNQGVGSTTSTLVHPADFLVGIERPEDSFVTIPGVIEPRVLALTPRGERLANQKVTLELVERRYTLAREAVRGQPAHAVSRVVDKVVATCQLVTAAVPRSCRLEAKTAGYLLVVARARDEKQRGVESAVGMYGIGAGEPSFGDDDRASVEIVPNKREYRVGETARLLVKSPFAEAEAWVTVERRGVYRSERLKLKGATPTVEVKITDELRPNAFVSVHLLRGRGPGRREDKVGASYRMGYVELRVDPEARRLAVTVTPKQKQLRPGDLVEVELSVADAKGTGRQAELTVFAVDEGVLMLTGYKTPDPLPVFTASRPLGVATLETREALARIGLAQWDRMLGADKGADGGGGGDDGARSDFRQTAFFDPNVLTDDKGRARVRFKLPDGLTTYRIMATAVTTDDRYGFGFDSVTANKPLMLRPALPRFLRAGDSVDAAVLVASKGAAPGSVKVGVKADGLVVEGEAERVVQLGSDATVPVKFRLRAERTGTAKLTFTASSTKERDVVTLERRVISPAPLEAIAVYGETAGRAAEQLGALSGLRNDVGGVEVRLASTALVGLATEFEALVEYPYACTEQLASRLLPLVPLRELARDFGFAAPPNAGAVIERTVGDILARQRDDGGFGMWPDSRESSLWVSPYALWTLHLAAERGVKVPKAALERGVAYVRESLKTSFERLPESGALALDVFAMLGRPDNAYVGRILENSAELPVFARALLLHALSLGKGPRAQRDELVRGIEAQIRIDGNSASVTENLGDRYAKIMDSPARTNALVLRALLSERPNHALITGLARGLLAARGKTGFRNTQEAAFALLALDEYRRVREKSAPSYVANAWFGEKKLLEFRADGRSTRALGGELSMAELKQAPNALLAFERDGQGTLYYEARLRYARQVLPKSAWDQGYFVQKTLQAVPREMLAKLSSAIPERSTSTFRASDLVVADLVVVTSGTRDYVVIEDPLPAGFEAIDPSLLTNVLELPPRNALFPCNDCGDEADDTAHGRAFRDAWFRQELRDDRVLYFVDHMPAGMYHYRYLARATSVGRFVLPPTKAEGMYEPETYGRTAATLVEVQ